MQKEICLYMAMDQFNFLCFMCFLLFAAAKMMLACYKGTCFLMILKHILIVNKQLYTLKLCNYLKLYCT